VLRGSSSKTRGTVSGSPRQPQGLERPRLRRRGRDPAPGRGPAVAAASRLIPRRSTARVKGAWRSFGPARWAALDPAAGAAAVDTRRPPVGRRQAARPRPERFRGNQPSVISAGIITASFTGADMTVRRTAHRCWSATPTRIPASQAYPCHTRRPHLAIRLLCAVERFQPAGVATVLVVVRAGRVCRRNFGAPEAGTTGAVGASEAACRVSPSGVPVGRVPGERAGSTTGSRRWRAGRRRPG